MSKRPWGEPLPKPNTRSKTKTWSLRSQKGVATPRLTPALPARLWLALARFACVVQENLAQGLGERSRCSLKT